MELYSKGTQYKLYKGDMLNLLDTIEPNSIDSVVTDPHTDLVFQQEVWEKCYAALKPGGHLLVFGYFNKYRRLACTIEDAGFEIRDSILWLFGSSVFPVFIPIKPAYASIIMARKPCEGTCVDNVLKYGVGGINIDGCRVEPTNEKLGRNNHVNTYGGRSLYSSSTQGIDQSDNPDIGRFPANVILTYSADDYDEVCGGMPYTESNGGTPTMPDLRDVGVKSKAAIGIDKLSFGQVRNADRKTQSYYVAPSDSGSASRYFFCAKFGDKDLANTSDTLPMPPCELLQYLVRMVTPPDGVVMDPFNYQGGVGLATMYENKERGSNFTYIGVEPLLDNLKVSADKINAVLPQ